MPTPDDLAALLGGQHITAVEFKGSVRMYVGDSSDVLLRFESPFDFETADGVSYRILGTPYDTQMELLRPLVGQPIAEVELCEGRLRLGFGGGSSLVAHPDERYESWQCSGPNGFLVVSMPGGELAVWSGHGSDR